MSTVSSDAALTSPMQAGPSCRGASCVIVRSSTEEPMQAVLELEPGLTVVRSAGIGRETLLTVATGWERLARTLAAPLSPTHIELAIERVEDAIGHPQVQLPTCLSVRPDETLRRLSQAATGNGDSGATITAEAVEAVFSRLAAQASGALPRAEWLPEDLRFAATLLILRELMHHLHVSALLLDPSM
jgi:hypothetical protein